MDAVTLVTGSEAKGPGDACARTSDPHEEAGEGTFARGYSAAAASAIGMNGTRRTTNARTPFKICRTMACHSLRAAMKSSAVQPSPANGEPAKNNPWIQSATREAIVNEPPVGRAARK